MSDEIEIFVCVSCLPRVGEANGAGSPGKTLVAAITDRLAADGITDVTVRPVECLAVCKRPCTIAMTAPGKWTYIIGDLEPDAHAGDIVSAAVAFQRSENGIVPWKERPAAFRKGVISRVPPMGFVQPETETA
jgi:predicted metal-binding protein